MSNFSLELEFQFQMATFILFHLLLLHYFVFPVYSYSETARLSVSASVVRIGDNITFDCISPQGYTGTNFASILFHLLHNNTELFGNEEADTIRNDISFKRYQIEISSQLDAGNYTCIITTTGPEKTVSAGAVLKVITGTDEHERSAGGDKTGTLPAGMIAVIAIVIVFVIITVIAAAVIYKKCRERCQENEQANTQGPLESGEETLELHKLETIGGVDPVSEQIDEKGNESTRELLQGDDHQANGV